MNLRRQSRTFQEDVFSQCTQDKTNIVHEVLLLLKFLQTMSQIKCMNVNYYDLFYTVIKNRDYKEIVNDEYENNENDYVNHDNFITPNHYKGSKIDVVLLR